MKRLVVDESNVVFRLISGIGRTLPALFDVNIMGNRIKVFAELVQSLKK